MGEARRRKLAGEYPARPPGSRPSRAELIGAAFDLLASGADPTLSGLTIITPDDNAPVYISVEDAKARPGGTQH